MRAFVRAFVILLVLAGLLSAAVVFSITRRGLSAREEPSRAEAFLARSLRRLATPADARSRTNPVEPGRAALDHALEHFADHCAVCHANDGSGNTEMGRNMYPRAPDMRAAPTQELTDGELFSIIENGIRLSGMPGWGTGTPEGERASWELVHFIRHLPNLTEEEIARMEALNPKSAAEWREAEEIRRFLTGEDAPRRSSPPHEHKRGQDPRPR